MHSIGEAARDSGLSVSALRFYDRAGVLAPAWVDPATGYRWYRAGQLAEARLLARLRRVQMPLPDIRLILASWSGAEPDLVRHLLARHVRRLETGLFNARRELSTVHELLTQREKPMNDVSVATGPRRLTVSASELATALDAVRFAVGSDPELPVLGGVLFDSEGDALQLVATDRYRMAVARTVTAGDEPTPDGAAAGSARSRGGRNEPSGAERGGERLRTVVPAPLVDAMRALLREDRGTVHLTLASDQLSLETPSRSATGRCLDVVFPDYRRLIQLPPGHRVSVDVASLREAVESGPVWDSDPREGDIRGRDAVPPEVTVLDWSEDGQVRVVADGETDGLGHLAVNREFLLNALAAGARDRLVLEFRNATTPLTIHRPDTEHTFSMLMPVRLTA